VRCAAGKEQPLSTGHVLVADAIGRRRAIREKYKVKREARADAGMDPVLQKKRDDEDEEIERKELSGVYLEVMKNFESKSQVWIGNKQEMITRGELPPDLRGKGEGSYTLEDGRRVLITDENDRMFVDVPGESEARLWSSVFRKPFEINDADGGHGGATAAAAAAAVDDE
jgi:hypothetical protein